MIQARPIADRFRLEELIGAGGFAQVYRATDLEIGTSVALKLMRERWRGDARVDEQFMNEARALRRLDGVATPALHVDGMTGDRRHYLVMDRVQGRSFGELLDIELPVGAVLEACRRMLDALDGVHQRGVVHGDLKASNVLIASGLAGSATVLIDFGLARVLDLPQRPSRTSAWAVGGTPQFMAPELSLGAPRTVASDIYAAGAILYELLTGFPPFSAGSTEDIAAHHRDEAVMPPSAVASFEVVPALDAIVLRALAKRAQDRFHRAADLAAALEPVARHATQTGSVRPPFKTGDELATWGGSTANHQRDAITQR